MGIASGGIDGICICGMDMKATVLHSRFQSGCICLSGSLVEDKSRLLMAFSDSSF